MKTWLIPVMALSLLVAPVQPWAVAQTVPAAPLVLAQSPAAEGGAVATPAQDFVAVLDLDALGGISKDEALIITSRLRANLLKTGKYRILERAKMGEILKEQGFQESGLCDTTACSVELGRLLAVNRILSGSVSKIGVTYTLNLRLLDVEKGTVLQEEFEDCAACELDTVLTRLTARLAVRMAGQQGDVNLQGGGVSATTPNSTIGTLNLTSMPPGAEVYINGLQKGSTPLKLDLPAGQHKLMLSGSDFISQNLDINLKAGTTLNQEVWMTASQLGRAKYGLLELKPQIEGVEVYLNGQLRGKTPLSLTVIPDMTYQLTFVHPDIQTQTERLAVKAGESLKPQLSFEMSEIGRYKAYKKEEYSAVSILGWSSIPILQLGYAFQGEWGWWSTIFGIPFLLTGISSLVWWDSENKLNNQWDENGANYSKGNITENNWREMMDAISFSHDANRQSLILTTSIFFLASYVTGMIHAPILANSKNEELRKKHGLTEADIKRIEASGQVTFFYQPPAQDGFYLTGGDLFNPSVGLGYRHGF